MALRMAGTRASGQEEQLLNDDVLEEVDEQAMVPFPEIIERFKQLGIVLRKGLRGRLFATFQDVDKQEFEIHANYQMPIFTITEYQMMAFEAVLNQVRQLVSRERTQVGEVIGDEDAIPLEDRGIAAAVIQADFIEGKTPFNTLIDELYFLAK